MTEQTTEPNPMSPQQHVRAVALEVARSVLLGRGITVPGVDAFELYNLASYIETGEDPWGGTE